MSALKVSLAVVAIGAGAIGGAGCSAPLAAGNSGASSPAQFVAVADQVCAGVPAKEREQGLLAYRESIISVAPLQEDSFVGKSRVSHTQGAVIVVRATPGSSVPWLERVQSCHVALARSGRLIDSELSGDPFAIPGTTVGVTETYAGYVLSVKGANREAGDEMLRLSTALLMGPAHPATASLEAP